jgi:hypothetical protein
MLYQDQDDATAKVTATQEITVVATVTAGVDPAEVVSMIADVLPVYIGSTAGTPAVMVPGEMYVPSVPGTSVYVHGVKGTDVGGL